TDQTVVTKDKVLRVEKEQPDEIAWLAVKNTKLGVNSLPLAQYDQVTRPLRAFVAEYPNSPHAGEARTILASFETEQRRVEAGEVRLGAKWLSKEEAGKEQYQINGLLAFEYMRAQVAAGDFTGALNSFEQIEKNYPGARSFPDAVETARAALAGLKGMVDRARQTYQRQQTEFEQGVAAASGIDRPQLLAARQREIAQGEAAMMAAEKAGLKWPPLVPRSDKSISALAQKIPNEQSRLASLEVAKFRESLQLTERAKNEIADQKLEAAEETLSKATDLWNANEIATRLKPEVAAARTAAAAAAAAQPAEVAEPMAAATPEPTTAATPAPEDEIANQEEEKSFFRKPLGIITLLVAVALLLGGLTAYKKSRARASEDLE
ncbi:MAG TPA: hypothetical protein VF593_08620, partial [Chthoniobacteraceae bacterium]